MFVCLCVLCVCIPFEGNVEDVIEGRNREVGTEFAPLGGMLMSFDGRPSTLLPPLNKYIATEATATAVFMSFFASFPFFLK